MLRSTEELIEDFHRLVSQGKHADAWLLLVWEIDPPVDDFDRLVDAMGAAQRSRVGEPDPADEFLETGAPAKITVVRSLPRRPSNARQRRKPRLRIVGNY